MSQNVDLADIFQVVTKSLLENKQTLNQADDYNQDHGDNMVQTFQTITKALKSQEGEPGSAALAYAAQQLSEKTQSSSGQLYARGLAEAAKQIQGKEFDAQTAMQVLQALISGGQAQAPAEQPTGADMIGDLLTGMLGGGASQSQETPQQGGDMLGSLLEGLTGSGASQPQETPQQGGDVLSSLLGGLTGGGETKSGLSDGLDLNDLLTAGMTFLQSKQKGGSNAEAAVQAFLAVSGMGNSSHRTQSTQLVVSSFLQALKAFKA